MADSGFWKCTNCGEENSDLDKICYSCKAPRYNPSSSADDEENTHGISAATKPISRRLFRWYVLVLLLLLAGTILVCILTPFGKRFIHNFNLGLVMDFSTTNFGKISSGLSWLGVLLVIGCGIYGGLEDDSFVGGAIVGALIYGALCLIIVVVWNYIVPLIVNAVVYITIVAGSLAFSFGSSVALVNYADKFITYVNPYPKKPGVFEDDKRRYYEDKAKSKEEFELRRSYFFGPGYFSVIHTIADAWKANFSVIKRFSEWIGDFGTLGKILGLIPFLFFTLSIAIFGSAATLACSVLHISFILPVMVGIYILFTIVWLVDRIYLQVKSIKSSCPYDQTRSVVPAFACPKCDNRHKRLVPGHYGIFHRKCTCGTKLPTTFLLGRSSLKAYCPKCGHELAASDVQQFSISVVGGSASGKTVLLSAFYHEFFDKIDKNPNAIYEIPSIHEDDFKDLKDWFNGVRCDATEKSITAKMYSVLLKSPAFDVDKQFSLYDIAGEAFDDPDLKEMLPQKQMRDSNGVIIVIDPLSAQTMREEAQNEGDDTSNYSEGNAAEVISNFVHYLKNVITGIGTKRKSEKPVAVVLSKTDLASISRQISYHYIKTQMKNTPEKYESLADARDQLCREFLFSIGLGDAVNELDANFTEVHYFPVSAIGHAANGETFEPEHVLEPFCWLIKRSDTAIAELLRLDDVFT